MQPRVPQSGRLDVSVGVLQRYCRQLAGVLRQ